MSTKTDFKPGVAEVFMDKAEYWRQAETLRAIAPGRRLPGYVFDFISVHGPPDIIGARITGFTLVSPMCIVEANRMKRPEFENRRFDYLDVAIEAAKELAIRYSNDDHSIFVVVIDREKEVRGVTT